MQNTKAGSIQIEQIKVGILVHNGKKTCSGKIPEPKKDENLILDLLGYYDIKEVITDIARKEVDLDTLKAGASLIPVAKITKVPKVVKAIGNVGKTGLKKGKEGEKIAKSGQAKQTKAKNKGGSGSKVETVNGDGSTSRLIPGTEGDITGGSSTKLGKNMLDDMGVPKNIKWTGYQAQHIIPAEMSKNPVLQKIGMDLDDASNGLFLRIPADDISAMSRHRGYHSTYNEFVKIQLDKMDVNQSVDVLQKQVYDLQSQLKALQQSGLPLYPNQGATVDLWERSLNRIK